MDKTETAAPNAAEPAPPGSSQSLKPRLPTNSGAGTSRCSTAPGKHTYKLYTIMDVFSRRVVGHRVEYTESAALAATLIRNAVADNERCPAVLHADNGGPMRAGTTLDLARALGITLSYSRPRVSDDNPYSESLFKTVKYCLDFPQRFQDLQHARDYMAAFFTDYNTNHRHSGLNYYTPDTVHY